MKRNEMTLEMIHQAVEEIRETQSITKEQLQMLLSAPDVTELFAAARETADREYGNHVYIRGLIEFTNYCKNDCLYCGIRRSNREVKRYRLSLEDIMACCEQGYALGFRTFVLQGGEDAYFTDERMCEIIAAIRAAYPDCAITLSIGEKERESYEKYYAAGANRYLLRHETADADHYGRLHPAEMSFTHRMNCIRDLREIGFQVGCGFMVGSPGQTIDTLYADLMYIRELQPHMVGIGPFIPQHATPMRDEKAGTVEDTIRLLAIIRLLHPKVLLPATTALGTIHPKGRELGMKAGANVVMPNLSPLAVRKKYALYDNKLSTGDEAAESLELLKRSMAAAGFQIVSNRGDSRVR